MPPPAPDPVALFVQILGTFLFCLIFLFLWRQSRIVYFGCWSLAWAVQSVALLCVVLYLRSARSPWLIPCAFFEFAFALALLAAARSRPIHFGRGWKSGLRLLAGFPLFLLLVYLLGFSSSFEGFHAMQALVLAAIYFYGFFQMRPEEKPGGLGAKLFRFTLLFLAVAFLHHAIVFFILYYRHALPDSALYLQYNNLYDFALQTLLAFAAMAIWIENLNDRIGDLDDELDRLRRESTARLDLDRLTGLLNQSALSKRTDKGADFSGVVAVCDMDNFKAVNDRYGHLVGDEILRNIGNLLRSSVRQQDEAFRWGGDEFVILFHNQHLEVVENRMREVQQRLNDFRVRGHGILPISFSWGVAETAGQPLREVLHDADQNMYAYKRQKSIGSGR